MGIEENIALMAKFKWEKSRLTYANVPTLVTESTLEEYYLDGGSAIVFPARPELRNVGRAVLPSTGGIFMWGTRTAPGSPWTEARAAMWSWTSWSSFTGTTCRGNGCNGHGASGFSRAPMNSALWRFNQIVQAFRDPQFNVLRANAHVISQVKRTLREAKDALFNAHMEGTDREILEYPLAR